MTCDNGPLRHKHHIIPKYKGGLDDPENLVEVSVTQHAMYHYCNYQLWGNNEDRLVWRGLSGLATKEELIDEMAISFGKKGYKKFKEKIEQNPELEEEYKEKRKQTWNSNRDVNIKKLKASTGSPESIEKKKKTFKQIKHQQGQKNSQYGKMWITDGTKEGSYRINKGDPIPEGFRPGRVSIKEENVNRIFVIITPEGKIVKTKNLTVYCNNNNINYNYFLKILKKKGNYKNYTGYIEYET